jgi:hypothetical protein
MANGDEQRASSSMTLRVVLWLVLVIFAAIITVIAVRGK